MKKPISVAILVAALAGVSAAWAKLPPPPPPDDNAKAAAEAKKAKDEADAEKIKAELNASEDRAVANYQQNMKKQGKPIPKPIPVTQASAPPKGADTKPQANVASGGANSMSGATK